MSPQRFLSKSESHVPMTVQALVAHVLESGDFYAAVAVHGIADARQRQRLEERLFGSRRDVLMLARWEHTPANVLDALSRLEHMPLARRVVKHRNTGGSTLKHQFSQSDDPALTGLLALHANTPAPMLLQIAMGAGAVSYTHLTLPTNREV